MKSASFVSMAIAIAVAAVSIGQSRALAPRTTPTSSPSTISPDSIVMTRRSAALTAIGSAFATAVIAPGMAFAEELTPEEKAAIARAKENMKKKIEASKKSYRKTNDLVKQRKETTDYSCLDKACPDGLSSEKK